MQKNADDTIRTELSVSPDDVLRFPHPNEHAEARLVCFPPAGAEAFMYDAWVTALPESIELCAVQLPEEYPEVSTVISIMAEAILKQHRQGQKLYFLGACLGAIWAYEVAQYLRDHADLQPDHLVIVTFPAPGERESAVAFMRTPKFAQIMTSYYQPNSPEYMYVLSRLPAALHTADLADQPLAPLGTPLDCPLTAFASAHDQIIDPQLLQAWCPYTSGRFQVHMCEGDHFYGVLHMQEFLQTVVAYLQGDLSVV